MTPPRHSIITPDVLSTVLVRAMVDRDMLIIAGEVRNVSNQRVNRRAITIANRGDCVRERTVRSGRLLLKQIPS